MEILPMNKTAYLNTFNELKDLLKETCYEMDCWNLEDCELTMKMIDMLTVRMKKAIDKMDEISE